ncbi:hypothetical protein [Oceanisphaera ostreae]|uniref:Uncharacterized protein n=1 Tax=Oceanisphaera ostreae TaxID=914151 RepID=A0ABW3KHZ2_9GAMM
MTVSFLEYRDENASHTVRMMSPMGMYPNHSIINEDSALYISNQICFSIAPVDAVKLEIDNYYSEVEWATLNEIKLYSSILLCIDRDYGYCRLFPFSISHRVNVGNSILNIEYLERVAAALINILETPSTTRNFKGKEFPIENKYKKMRGIELPTIQSGIEYGLNESRFNLKLQQNIYQDFDTEDHLMIRAVSTLFRSIMLGALSNFLEESINTTFISLEASFRLVLKRLHKLGNKNPSSKDAAEFIGNVFSSDVSEKYFGEYYESRIMSFHPESRFGVFPHAPLMADDSYDLADDLIEVYCYLITGYIKPNRN